VPWFNPAATTQSSKSDSVVYQVSVDASYSPPGMYNCRLGTANELEATKREINKVSRVVFIFILH
jgi:hypothetical protein